MASHEPAAHAQPGLFLARADRRQGYRIDPGFQTDFRTMLLAFSVLILVAVALLATGVLYVVQHPDSVPASPWVPGSLFAFALATGAAIFHVSDRISHRYCGPIRRISSTLEAARRGERPSPIRLRRQDEFHALAEAVNATLQTLGAMDRPAPPVNPAP